MAGRTAYNCASDGCEPRIPLFPLRYSARPRQVVDTRPSTYADSGLPLESGFPPLARAQYDLRCIGAGFIYLIDETRGDFFVWKADDGQFIELLAKTRTLDEALKNYKEGNRVPYLWARQGSRVHLLPTDTLLTTRRLRELQLNKDGIRDRLATTLDVATWSQDAPSGHSFPAECIGELVEEYKGSDSSHSPWQVTPRFPRAGDLLQSMKAVAPQAQIAVVMHDHIALVQELSGIIQQARQRLQQYTSAPDQNSDSGDVQRFRKKVIADLIDRIYESAYAADKGFAEGEKDRLDASIRHDIDRLKRRREQLAENLAVAERHPALTRTARYQTARKLLDSMPSEPIGRRAEALSSAARRYAQHVDEKKRVAFLQTFADEVNRLHLAVIEHKNDRWQWLRTYDQVEASTDLGCAFLRYDTSNTLSSTSHAVAFASCSESMIWGPAQTPAGTVDRERELFGQWWATSGQANPLLTNMDYDQGYGTTIWDTKSDVVVDTSGKVLGSLLRFGAIHLLMEQVGVYTLHRKPQTGSGSDWRGAVRDSVDQFIHRMAGTNSPDDAARLRGILETRYGDRLVIRSLTYQEAADYLAKANGLPEGALPVGSIARGAGDSMQVLMWDRLTPLTRYANPFLQVFDRGAAGGVAVLSLWNLKAAAEKVQFEYAPEELAGMTNLAAAIMGLGMATHGALLATRPLMPAVYTRASITGAAMRWLVSEGAVRWFGYLGAAFDAFTNWFKAWGQLQKGNTDSATYYALAGLGIGLGGVVLTASTTALVGGASMSSAVGFAGSLIALPIWGWLVAGIILLGAGLWWLHNGDNTRFSELEFWLNDGTFGQRKPMGREAEQARYATLDDESKAYVMACYAPQKVDVDWKVLGVDTPSLRPAYSPRLVLKIAYPMEGEIEHPVSTTPLDTGADSTPAEQAKLQITLDKEEQIPSGGKLHTYVITGLRKEDFNIKLKAAYTPAFLDKRLEKIFTI